MPLLPTPAVVLLCCWLASGWTLAAQTDALFIDRPLAFVLDASNPRTFTIDLQTGQYLRVTARCPSSSLTIGTAGLSATTLGGTGGTATLAFVADKTGEYRITAKSSAIQSQSAPCSAEISALREATEADRADAQGYVALLGEPKDFTRAAALARTADDIELGQLTEILNARARITAGKFQEARAGIEAALPLARRASNKKAEAAMLYVAGLAGIYMEDSRAAIPSFEAALPLQRAEGQAAEAALTLHNLSVAHWVLGECQTALQQAGDAVVERRRMEDRRGEGYSLLAVAKDRLCLGDSQQALDTYAKVLPLWRELKNGQLEASALNDLGLLHTQLGDYTQASDYHTQALTIRRKLKDTSGEAESLNNIGQLKIQLRDYAGALPPYLRALDLQRAAHFTRGEGYALQGVAEAREGLGNHQDALPLAEESVRLLHSIGERGGEGDAWQVVARCQLGLKQADRARIAFQHALELEQAVGQPSQQIETLTALAKMENADGHPERGRPYIEQALGLIERSRADVVSRNLRTSYAAKQRDAYEVAAGILMRAPKTTPLDDPESAAFRVSELTHARVLLDALTEHRAGIRDGAAPEFLARQQALDRDLTARLNALPRISAEERTRADREIADLLQRREQLDAELRRASPRYASLVTPQPPSLQAVQKLLPPGGVLLEYLVGQDGTWLWSIDAKRCRTFSLPPRKELDALVSRLYAALTARNRRDVHETLAARQVRFREADARAARLISVLRKILLPEDALPSGTPSVLVVPDESLQHVPFAALSPGTQFVRLPSAAVLAEIREAKGNASLSPLLLIGDPIFTPADPRIHRAGTAAVSDAQASGQGFTRLLRSREEVRQIARLAKPAASKIALDFEASANALIDAGRFGYGLIHIASHATLNDRQPDLSGIALSSFDVTGHPQSGFLHLYEIYNLRLQANLVTLSACGTALGKDVKGEGLTSLARGFLYAGTSRVLASLWSVDDAFTMEFMSRFYRSIYRDGLAPAAALHRTANSMRRDPRWSSPYYWAAFILQGDPE